MTPEHLRKLWQILSVACLLLVLDAWIAIQGGAPVFGNTHVAGRDPASVATFGLVFGLALYLAAIHMALGYARTQAGDHWHRRIPPMALRDLDSRDPQARRFLLVLLAALTLVPLGAFVHFTLTICEARIACKRGAPESPYDLTAFAAFGLDDPCRIARSLPQAAPGTLPSAGITWFPVVQPALFLAATAAAFAQTIRLWTTILRRP